MMGNQQGQPPDWYPLNQGWGSTQQPPQWQRPQQDTQYPPQWQPRTPYPQPPNTQYPPSWPQQPPPYYSLPQQYQQPYYYPPPMRQPPPPRKQSRLWLWLVLSALVFLILCGSLGKATQSSSTADTSSTTDTSVQATDAPTPTDTPTPVLTWTTTHTFQGNGLKKTSVFTVADHWRLKWKCNPSSDYFGTYNVIVDVHSSDGTLLDGAINTICQAGNTSGETEEYQGGDIYLDAQIDGAWAIEVQELQ